MTDIYFYSGATEKLLTVCRLSAKATRQGLSVLIYTLDPVLVARLDKMLWTFSATSFIPHGLVDDKLASVTPVLIGHDASSIIHNDVLINLHEQYPPFFNQFNRFVEIVGIESNDKAAARRRYRFYQEEGYVIQHYKLDI